MRLTRWQVELLGFEIARSLVRSGAVEGDIDRLADTVRHVITEDLMVEDKLDEEVRGILAGRADEMRRLGVDYSLMFEKAKKQLIRDRKLVL